MERVREHSLVLDQPVKFRAGMPVWLAERLYRELRTPDDMSPVAIEGLAFELVAEFGREALPKRRCSEPIWLSRVIDLLETRFREHLTLKEIGQEAAVHPVHLVTVFRRHLRCTPFDFVRQRRVAFAARQLLDSQKSLAQIGLDAGFAHQSHFCRVFKSLTGMTPLAYRGHPSPILDPGQSRLDSVQYVG
jgi:AraC-like DNA-binding protein